VWAGGLFGFLEAGALLVRQAVFGQFLFLSGDYVWMTPAAGLILFALCGLFWAGLACLFRVRFTCAGTSGLFVFLAAFSALSACGCLSILATLVLACGIAVQTGRLAARHVEHFNRLTGWTTAVILSTVVLIAVARAGWQQHAERQALAALPPLPPAHADPPNVLFIVLDTVRAESLSLYDPARDTTPQLDRFARTGVTFDAAVTTSSWTLPSHASMFTGRYPHEMNADWFVPLDDDVDTLAEFYRDRGYVTAGFVANRSYCSYESGLTQGFGHYEDYQPGFCEMLRCMTLTRLIADSLFVRRRLRYFDKLGRKDAAAVNDGFLSWLSRHRSSRRGDRPFFAFLNFYDAHNPYLPRDCHCGPDTTDELSLMMQWTKLNLNQLEASDVQLAREAYEASIRSMDRRIGELLSGLQRGGWLDNTVVVITSDHGEHFGERGVFLHGTSLYPPLLHVPLVISAPGRVPADVRIAEPVTQRDLAATMTQLTGFSGESRFPGRTLARCWDEDHPSARSPLLSMVLPNSRQRAEHADYPVAAGQMWSLILDGKQYIRRGDGVEELYRFPADASASDDLAQRPEFNDEVERRRALLDEYLTSTPR
jgi:arylsulfatase A-like enzyme